MIGRTLNILRLVYPVMAVGMVPGLLNAQDTPLQHDWENPGIISYNKQHAHATLVPCPDIESALQFNKLASENIMMLNGTWKFYWSADTKERPVDFYLPDYNDSAWDDIEVPGNWEL